MLIPAHNAALDRDNTKLVLPKPERTIHPSLLQEVVDFSPLRAHLFQDKVSADHISVRMLAEKFPEPELDVLRHKLLQLVVLAKSEWIRASAINPDNDTASQLVELLTRESARVVLVFHRGKTGENQLVGVGSLLLDQKDFDPTEPLPNAFLEEKIWSQPQFAHHHIVRGNRLFTARYARNRFEGDVATIVLSKALELTGDRPNLTRVATRNGPSMAALGRMGWEPTGVTFHDETNVEYEWLIHPPFSDKGREELARVRRGAIGLETFNLRRVAGAVSALHGSPLAVIGRQAKLDSRRLSDLMPGQSVIAVLPSDVRTPGRKGHAFLRFQSLTNSNEEDVLPPQSIRGIFLPGTLGEIPVEQQQETLRRFIATLKDNQHATIVDRDFTRSPLLGSRLLTLTKNASIEVADGKGVSIADLFLRFVEQPGMMAGQPWSIEHESDKELVVRCSSTLVDGFYLLGFYYKDWERELNRPVLPPPDERIKLYQQSGMRVVSAHFENNPWIRLHRWEGRMSSTDLAGRPKDPPPTGQVVVAIKVAEGEGIRWEPGGLVETSASKYLTRKIYRNTDDDSIWEIAHRSNQRVEYVPLTVDRTNGKVRIGALTSRSRPITTLYRRSEALDQRYLSGYLSEPLGLVLPSEARDFSLSNALQYDSATLRHLTNGISQRFEEGFKVRHSNNEALPTSLLYYASPGGLTETVITQVVPLDKPDFETLLGARHDGGFVRSMEPHQALWASLAGSPSDGRLERIVYNLLHISKIDFGPWPCDPVILRGESNQRLSTISELDLITPGGSVFEETDISPRSSYFSICTRDFTEFDDSGNELRRKRLEYLETSPFVDISHNTMSMIPLFRGKDEIYIGLEQRDLPAVYAMTGKSRIWVVPAYRLSRDIRTIPEAVSYCRKCMSQKSEFGITARGAGTLGASYFPSISVTPEVVYPAWVEVDEPGDRLRWLPLSRLPHSLPFIQDGHSLTSLYRILHALDFTQAMAEMR